ncbi:hypothetical protein CQ046_02435 [Chryseobacterium sp. MYb7]|uniref:hypothetical protein n=1 Tax=Chryseobacterium sp. MYb7 TaxID=1827290 RepID=UPI000D01192E|nr:hypothetical protein [Chryseobacterium sp. MYb7]PRB06053.1 hypothetical protein CQ046_02435 [Chryseobacterium sp. MYb7]
MKNNYIGKIVLLLVSINSANFLNAQVGVGTTNPNSNAVLELSSTSKGLLLSRVALTNTTSSSPLSAHEKGMVVYNTAVINDVVEGMYENDGTKWNRLYTNQPNVGDVYYSFVASDHQGWYLLDGRNITSLPAAAQTNAAKIGITTSLPNAADRYLKQKGASALLSTAGTQTTTLLQQNLPNITYTGTTSSNGNHSHQYVDRGQTTWNHGTGTATFANTAQLTNQNTGSAGNHSHTVQVSSGGSGTAIDTEPKNLAANTFIYLGL